MKVLLRKLIFTLLASVLSTGIVMAIETPVNSDSYQKQENLMFNLKME